MEKILKSQLASGKFENRSPAVSNLMRAVRGSDNRTTERRFRLALVRNGIRGWKLQVRGLPGRPDFFFPAGKGLAVFVDGCYWHGCPECGHAPRTNAEFWQLKFQRNTERDRRADIELAQAGIQVLRFWEHDIKRDLPQCVARVVMALKQAKTLLPLS